MDCSLPGSSGPWDSPGKNTGVGCHALLQRIFPGIKPWSAFTVWATRKVQGYEWYIYIYIYISLSYIYIYNPFLILWFPEEFIIFCWLLNLGTLTFWLDNFCHGDCPVRCKMLTTTLCLYTLDSSSTSHVLKTISVSRHYQISPEGKKKIIILSWGPLS